MTGERLPSLRARLALETASSSGFGGGSAYRPDLDGLRAVAVGLVILTHAQFPWRNNGGDAGVTAFFVLSGYVITRLLLRQHAEGRPDILGFYRRRFVRLGPALAGLLAFTLVTGILVGWPTEWQVGIASCLLYVSNWVQVAGINIDPLGHTWSLAIEEQFYLVWPALLFGLIAWRRDWLIPMTILLIVLGSLVRVASSGLFEYFSTFTRADAILLGCLVALAGIRLPAWTAGVGVAGLVAVALLVAPENHSLAIPLSMLAATAVICGEFRPLARLAPAGLRAYSLYLWNWPMVLLFGTIPGLAVLLTILVGELSFRLFEGPVLRRGGIRAAAHDPTFAAAGRGR